MHSQCLTSDVFGSIDCM
ncbi:MAG: hypothetical protein K1X72_19405 [Pyrinomonadaceae bacterium]|nr:hypothetical protein [Pyrinomonadaceae bacterium]